MTTSRLLLRFVAPHSRPVRPVRAASRFGFTLIEMLVATAITLMLVGALATIFGRLSNQVAESRASVEMSEGIRGVKLRLQSDFKGITAKGMPPLRSGKNLGYLEIQEGGIGPIYDPSQVYYEDVDGDGTLSAADLDDTTVGDNDDVLQFTTHSQGEPFTGRFGATTTQAEFAEVSWFLRGTTLYRRQLLIKSGAALPDPPPGTAYYDFAGRSFYAEYDVSARQVGGLFDLKLPASPGDTRLVANSLGDLTRRESRYGHQPWAFPHDARDLSRELRLPTLRECASPTWPFPSHIVNASGNLYPSGTTAAAASGTLIYPNTFPAARWLRYSPGNNNVHSRQDLWNSPHPWTVDGTVNTNSIVDTASGTLSAYAVSPRIAEDVIATNVLMFDVKVWDPGAPIFYDAVAGQAVQPGDSGYVKYVTRFIDAPLNANFQPIGFGAFVDLNYMCLTGREPTAFLAAGGGNGASYEFALRSVEQNTTNPGAAIVGSIPRPRFAGAGIVASQLRGQDPPSRAPGNALPAILPVNALAAVYDTGCYDYERDGFDNNVNGLADEATDGVDNNANGLVDDLTELESPPPYLSAARGIQIRLRVFEPSTRQIRDVTVVQELNVD